MATRIFSNTPTITIQRIPEVNNNREPLTRRENFIRVPNRQNRQGYVLLKLS
jgi:hypothetical protein